MLSGKPLTGITYELAKSSARQLIALHYMKEFSKLGYTGTNLSRAVNGAMNRVTEFDKEYLGKGMLYDYAFNGKAKELVKNNPARIFDGKVAVAIHNLENKEYEQDIKGFVRDAAYASCAQLLRIHGKLTDPKTGKTVDPDKYVKTLIDSNKFKNSLKTGEPPKWRSPKAVLKAVKDDESMIKAQNNMIKADDKERKASIDLKKSDTSIDKKLGH